MSFRSATRLSSRLAARTRVQSAAAPASRRWASSGGAKPSSDTTWMIGSAVGFGSLATFLLYPSKADTHAALHSSEHAQHRAEINESAPTVAAGDAIQATDSGKYSPKSADPSDIHKHADRGPERIPVKKDETKTMPSNLLFNDSLKPEAQGGGKNANETAKAQLASGDSGKDSQDPATGKGSSGSESGSSGQGGGEGEPSQQDVKDSIKQAEQANTPKAAMDQEAKGADNSSEGKQGGGDGEPSAQDVKDSILQAERANTPRAAMDKEVKESS
ncbi:uncharacterized protein I303_107801 [Kwoniella dejecticola CBS 10117]|uniref:Uncharacterized protein n=1 Tax=Kwoniella dejecticola CBS 10117 TaxID=1296121 RepID=A0A1A5ZVR7_9TREE|nr:uncharacterized protein I303_07805 [Kwoniella dejecticola CBS 10117]OBR81895.1 hypothetical protein I303_07805 [Kwoniella dejecticola CBS 10117]